MDFSKIMKQAQQLQKQMAETQDRIKEMRIEGVSGGGMVSLVLTGDGRMVSLSINDSLLEEGDMLSDLIVAAHNDAWQKLEKKKGDAFEGVTGGMSGFPAGLPF